MLYVYTLTVATRPEHAAQTAARVRHRGATTQERRDALQIPALSEVGPAISCWAPGPLGDGRHVAADELPQALLGALRRFGPAWLRWVRGHVGEGLSPARLQLLGHLAAADGPLIMRELTHSLGITPRAVTGLVDALEAECLVRREPHPTDRRATLVWLAQSGREVLMGERARGMAAAGGVFRVLSEQDQRALLRILNRLTAVLDEPESAGPESDAV